MSKHKCADCGYLAARNIDTRGLDEVEKTVREIGKPMLVKSLQAQAQGWKPDKPKHEELLICFMQKRDLNLRWSPKTGQVVKVGFCS
jgi:hypothetical protein